MKNLVHRLLTATLLVALMLTLVPGQTLAQDAAKIQSPNK